MEESRNSEHMSGLDPITDKKHNRDPEDKPDLESM